MEREIATVWLTRHALSGGVRKCECQIDPRYNSATPFKDGFPDIWASVYVEGRDWHRTRESALARVEKMRVAKIKSLQKQIDKLATLIDVPE